MGPIDRRSTVALGRRRPTSRSKPDAVGWHRSKGIRTLAAVIALVGLLAHSGSAADSVICHRPDGIDGFASELGRAGALFGEVRVDRIGDPLSKFYLTERDGYLYVQSNVRVSGDTTTKLATNEDMRLLDLIANLDESPSQSSFSRARSALVDSHFYAEMDLILSDRFRHVLKEASSVSVLPRAGTEDVISPGSLHWVATDRSRRQVEPMIDGPLGVLVRASDVDEYVRSVRSGPLRVPSIPITGIRTMSTTDNLRTQRIVDGSGGLAETVLSREALVSRIESSRGFLVAVVGHVRDGGIASRTPDGTERFFISFDEMKQVSERSGALLAVFGCDAVGSGARSGTVDPIVASADVVRRLVDSSRASSVSEAISSLGQSGLAIAFDGEDLARLVAQHEGDGLLVDRTRGRQQPRWRLTRSTVTLMLASAASATRRSASSADSAPAEPSSADGPRALEVPGGQEPSASLGSSGCSVVRAATEAPLAAEKLIAASVVCLLVYRRRENGTGRYIRLYCGGR